MSGEPLPPAVGPEPPPPVLGRWSRVYAVVLAALAVTIAIMGWLTEHYR